MSTQVAALPNPWRACKFRTDVFWWMVTVHVLGLIAAPAYILYVGTPRSIIVAAAVFWLLVHLSITLCHRHYAHLSFVARKGLEVVMLVLHAAALQASALWWNARHMEHHDHSDTPKDPYTVRHGFWWAHMVWVFFVPAQVPPTGRKLMGNRILVWQHENYWWLSIISGLGIPALLGWMLGDVVGGILMIGFARLVVQYHATWCINSVSHTFGQWMYKLHRTARTNVPMAFLNVGEGYHERHHWAPRDYRLGPKAHHLDLGKWVIRLCAIGGWAAHSLRIVSEEELLAQIERKQRLEAPLA